MVEWIETAAPHELALLREVESLLRVKLLEKRVALARGRSQEVFRQRVYDAQSKDPTILDWLLYGDGGRQMTNYTTWASQELSERDRSCVGPSSTLFNPSVQTALTQWISERCGKCTCVAEMTDCTRDSSLFHIVVSDTNTHAWQR